MTTVPLPLDASDFNVCLWPLDPACLLDEWEALDPDAQLRARALASATLHRLTGYRVGGCPVTVRPCKVTCAEEYGFLRYGYGGPAFTPHISMTGQWVNGCGCRTDCSCGPLCEVRLSPPIGEIISVDVGGVDYTAQVKIMEDRMVYTGPDDCPFPSCQNLAADPGTEGTFTVEYRNSYPIDGMGAYAAGLLAVEFAKACSGKKCKLPRGTTSVVRQGVSIEITTGMFPDGYTGIDQVDAYISLWKPDGSPRQAPKIWSPRRHSGRVEI